MTTVEFQLRDYQKELAEPGLRGNNCMIVAPTGSGKTYVALKICTEHIALKGTQAKVIFLVPKVPLVQQQFALFKKHVGDAPKVIFQITGETNSNVPVHKSIQNHVITVMTPQILLNLLSDELMKIGEISLLIFDECHHVVGNDPYNRIMTFYMDEKLRSSNPQLPQVVGLTALPGMGKAKTMKKAEENIQTLMANLDVTIAPVQAINCMNSLRGNQTETNDIMVPVAKRYDDTFTSCIKKVMERIHLRIKEDMKKYKAVLEGSLQYDLRAAPGSQDYESWTVTLLNKSKIIKDAEASRTFMTYAGHLRDYNTSLMLNDHVRSTDARNYLQYKVLLQSNAPSNAVKEILLNIHKEACEDAFDVFDRNPKQNSNPMLERLQIILTDEFKKSPNSRCIIFVKTRAISSALVTCLNDHLELNTKYQVNPKQLVGSAKNADNEDGMTKNEQEDTLQAFKDGSCKVIVATSVAEEGLDIKACNLIVTYNYSTNEIGRVQRKGRGRAKNSRMIMLAYDDSGHVKRERENEIRVEITHDILNTIRSLSVVELKKQINEIQLKLKKSRDFELEVEKYKKRLKKPNNKTIYRLSCLWCRKVVTTSVHFRHIDDKHRVVVDPKFVKLAKFRKVSKHGYDNSLDADKEFSGEIICGNKNCALKWGWRMKHLTCHLCVPKIENFVVTSDMGYRKVCKRWKDVPFNSYIRELAVDDLRNLYPNSEGGDQEETENAGTTAHSSTTSSIPPPSYSQVMASGSDDLAVLNTPGTFSPVKLSSFHQNTTPLKTDVVRDNKAKESTSNKIPEEMYREDQEMELIKYRRKQQSGEDNDNVIKQDQVANLNDILPGTPENHHISQDESFDSINTQPTSDLHSSDEDAGDMTATSPKIVDDGAYAKTSLPLAVQNTDMISSINSAERDADTQWSYFVTVDPSFLRNARQTTTTTTTSNKSDTITTADLAMSEESVASAENERSSDIEVSSHHQRDRPPQLDNTRKQSSSDLYDRLPDEQMQEPMQTKGNNLPKPVVFANQYPENRIPSPAHHLNVVVNSEKPIMIPPDTNTNNIKNDLQTSTNLKRNKTPVDEQNKLDNVENRNTVGENELSSNSDSGENAPTENSGSGAWLSQPSDNTESENELQTQNTSSDSSVDGAKLPLRQQPPATNASSALPLGSDHLVTEIEKMSVFPQTSPQLLSTSDDGNNVAATRLTYVTSTEHAASLGQNNKLSNVQTSREYSGNFSVSQPSVSSNKAACMLPENSSKQTSTSVNEQTERNLGSVVTDTNTLPTQKPRRVSMPRNIVLAPRFNLMQSNPKTNLTKRLRTEACKNAPRTQKPPVQGASSAETSSDLSPLNQSSFSGVNNFLLKDQSSLPQASTLMEERRRLVETESENFAPSTSAGETLHTQQKAQSETVTSSQQATTATTEHQRSVQPSTVCEDHLETQNQQVYLVDSGVNTALIELPDAVNAAGSSISTQNTATRTGPNGNTIRTNISSIGDNIKSTWNFMQIYNKW